MVLLIYYLHVSAAQAETEAPGDDYDEYDNYNEYDEDDLPDYNFFNATDATEEREKPSQPAVLVESNEIPEDAAAAEEEEEDATRDLVPENIEIEAARGGKILGGASVKSLGEGTMSREELVLTSEEAIRDNSSLLDEQLMKMEESTATDEKAEKDKKVEISETKEPEAPEEPEALSSTAPASFLAFSLMSITFLTILTSNSISRLAIRT